MLEAALGLDYILVAIYGCTRRPAKSNGKRAADACTHVERTRPAPPAAPPRAPAYNYGCACVTVSAQIKGDYRARRSRHDHI